MFQKETRDKLHELACCVDALLLIHDNAQFFELREEARQKGLQVTDQELWYSLVEGHYVKNCVLGVGDYEREMRKINPSSKPHRSRSRSRSTVQRRWQHLKSKTKCCRNKLIV